MVLGDEEQGGDEEELSAGEDQEVLVRRINGQTGQNLLNLLIC